MFQIFDTAGLVVGGEVGEGPVAPAEMELLCADLERDLSSPKDVAEGGGQGGCRVRSGAIEMGGGGFGEGGVASERASVSTQCV